MRDSLDEYERTYNDLRLWIWQMFIHYELAVLGIFNSVPYLVLLILESI